MSKEPRNKAQHGRHASGPSRQHHGSTAEETAALNETFKSFSEKYYEPNEKTERRKRIKFRLEIAFGVGVAFNILLTLGLLIAGALQVHYSGDQVTASQGQLRTMQDQEQRQLRAYVGIQPGDIEDFGIIGKQRLKFTRKNYGNTPAYSVGFTTVGTQIIKIGAPITVSAGGCGAPKIGGLMTIFPGAELPWTITIADKFPDKELESVRASDSQFVYFGDI